MKTNPCPECGQPMTGTTACPRCGEVLANGTAPEPKPPAEKPPPPAEVANWVIHQTPPEMLEELRRTFNEEEFLADMKEIEETGGVKFEDLIREIEEIVKGRD